MFARFLFGLILLVVMPGSSCAGTLNDYLTRYDRSKADQQESLETLVLEANRTLWWTDRYLRSHGDDPLFCASEVEGLSGRQIVDLLRESRRIDPKIGGASVEVALLLSLKRSYPCHIH